MTPKKIEDLLKLAKKHGLKTLKIDGLEFEFFQKRLGIVAKSEPIPKDEDMPSDEEFLYYSSPYDPKQEREEAQEMLKSS